MARLTPRPAVSKPRFDTPGGPPSWRRP